MRAHDSFLSKLLKLGETVFYIPVFQRNYDWDTDNCQQLFSDLETIAFSGREHFIGNIVYVSTGTATEQNYNIIDGQQRITSVMLFMKALHDLTDDTKLKKQIRNGYLLSSDDEDEVKVKLKQVESDSSIFEKLILHREFREEDYTDAEKQSNIYRNYSFFKERITESPVGIADLYNSVALLEIIDVLLTTEDPQEVFESMNSTGKNLTNTDLLRNYLLMALPHSTQEKLYKKYWAKIQNNVGSKTMEQYMVHYLIMKRKSDSINLHRRSAKVNKNNLYDCYKLYFPAEEKKDNGTEKLLSDMYRYSSVYRRIVNNDEIKTELDRAIHELINELNADQAAIFLLYLLDYQEQHNIGEDEMLKAVRACISYVFRLRMFKGSISSQFFALAIQYFDRCDESMSFTDRVWKALTSGQGSYRFPRDLEFQNAFETKDMYLEFKPPFIRYILYKYERARTKEVVEPENTTIEHILPRDSTQWLEHLKSIADNAYPEYIHKIGNLTLTKLNSEMSNNSFAEKKKIYEVSNYMITRELSSVDDWNSDEIRKRCARMAQEAVSIWNLPKEYNSEEESDVIFNMDEETEHLFDTLREMITGFDSSIVENINKHYINYKRQKKNLISVIPKQNYISVVLAAKKEELFPNEKLEDVSYKGHLGNGDTMMRLESEDDIWQLLEYIEQIDQDIGVAEDLMQNCLKQIKAHVGSELKKITKKAYRTQDYENGYVFCTSKSYGQGNRKRYWYAYRRELINKINQCANRYVVFGCGGTDEILVVPQEAMEAVLEKMNYSSDLQGQPKYWHVVLFRDRDGKMTQLLSKPIVQEIDMEQYIIR
ncbi:MAG: DUF262 domain-containing protein [Clostridia bacterium]|nr:DUF262 domain-containing protein [Clostridia bacterium]